MTLAEQVNLRRLARGREPLRIAHIERAIRFVQGNLAPKAAPESWYKRQLRLRRAYLPGRGGTAR